MKLRGLKNQVWVTAAVTDADAKRALILANSLKRVISSRSLAIMVSGKVAPNLRERLHYEFDHVYILEEDRNNANLKPEDFAKISALTLRSFDKCVFVSPSMMFLKNADEIFDLFDGASFICMENDEMMQIFGYKPSMDAYNVLMKALGCRNGTPVAKYIQNWFRNQYGNQEYRSLEAKYNKKISLRKEALQFPTFTDTVIVNFLDDPKCCQEWKEGNNPHLSLVDYHAIKIWLELYNENVHNIDSGSIPQDMEYTKEPIAIVGMSCRFPGSNNLEEFWNLLFNGEDATGNPPPFRWLREQCSRNRPDCNKTNAGFLKVPVDEFDAKFFGISPKEALLIDPQHRLLHELVWEGLEDASLDPHTLRGTSGSVFMGSWLNDFRDILTHSGNSEFYRLFMGNSIGAAAARISFLLGMTGPSMATESGCSSAMVAVHLACRSLQFGETNLALACGVNLLLHPFDKDEMPMVISPDGHCKTFSEDANGFARAEGAGVLVLKRLSDAMKDGDHIWGLIRGSAMSQEGVSKSMGTPTVHCESLAMKDALRDAKISPEQVAYVETHGTGTVVGDPMEVAAIAKAYNSPKRKEPLIIGSVKTNVGHTESCSGITGIMKVILSMQHEAIPAHRNFTKLNPSVNLSAVPAVIPLECMEWKKVDGKPRIAGVSSFGITGTDAHAIIEEPPCLPENGITSDLERPQHILKISAKTDEALDILLEKFGESIENSKDNIADIAYTANIGRASFPLRVVVTGNSKEDIANKIRQNQISRQEVCMEDIGKVCFLFTGQGSQYPGMAKRLYETNTIFQMHFDYCEGLLNEMYHINIRNVLWGESQDKSDISRTIYSQTSIFCVEYALLKLWESWGVKPDFALGHSLGEFAAAVCAGILSVQDAIRLVAERSKLIDKLPRGKMLVVKADKSAVEQAMKTFSGGNEQKMLDYAAVNSSQQTVVAGDADIVLDFSQFCTENNIKCMVLEATHAFHSKHMDPMLEKYRAVARNVQKQKGNQCEYISGMKGDLVSVADVDSEYWVQHTREKVSFLDASKKAVELGCQIFVEVGPQPVLSALTMMNNEQNLTCLPSLKRNEDEWDTILGTVGKLYLKGLSIDWAGFDQLYKRKKVRLPHYPFIGKKFWPDMLATTGNTIHPLLGCLIPNASSTKIFQNGLNTRCLEYVKDHAIGQTAIFPGAGYLEMALAAGHSVVECCTDSMTRPSRPMKVENLIISAPLALEEAKTSQVQITVDFNIAPGQETGDWNDMSVKIFHRLDTKWLPHASASFVPLPSADEIKNAHFDKEIFDKFCSLPSDDQIISQLYDKLASVGLVFGPVFRSVEKLWKDETGKELLVKVALPPANCDSAQYIIHPAVIDCMIQSFMMQKYADKIKRRLYVPISISKFIFFANAQGEELYIYLKSEQDNESEVFLIDELGNVVAIMSGIELIDTTVKAVESVLEQQTSVLPDMWEETWRSKTSSMCQRIPDHVISQTGFTEKFQKYIGRTYNTVPEEKEKIFKDLEEFVYYWILNGLYECGWKPEIGQTFTAKQLVHQLQIEETYYKFINWFMEVLEQEKIVAKSSDDDDSTWRVISIPSDLDLVKSQLNLQKYSDTLVKQFDATRLIRGVGENLPSIFKGSQSPLQILFPEDVKNCPSVSGFYDDYATVFNVAGSVSDAHKQRLSSWINGMDQMGKINIIEIGAGTGVFTSHILPVFVELGVDFEYTYTDISPAFFSAAEKRFETYKNNMKFKRLNIEEDPISQGFCADYYDYAVASDVVHATKDVCQTLSNVRKLLRQGGNFDIMEQIQKNRLITFIFGLMDGFWRMADFRKDHCILTAPVWETSLQKSGFNNIITFPSFNGRHGLITSNALKSTSTPTTTQLLSSSPTWLVFSSPQCKLSNFLTGQIEMAERRIIHVQPGAHYQQVTSELCTLRGDEKVDFEELMTSLKTQNAKVEGIIYMWALDKNRTKQEEILQPYFYIAQTVFSLKQKITPRICAVTQGIAPVGDNDLSHFQPSTLWGFTKTFRNENTDVNCRCISIENDAQIMSDVEMKEVFHEIWSEDMESQVAFCNGHRHVPRFQPLKVSPQDLSLPPGTNRFKLILPETKSIGDLQFGPLDHLILEQEEVEIQVKASALNFRDVFSVMKPTEQFKNINAVGFDFAGIVKRLGAGVTKWQVGDHVFGVNISGDPLPSHIKLNENQVLRIPSNDMTFCEAASIPAVYATTIYCLQDVAKVTKCDTVLIHTASGGVGLSALKLLKSIGCKIIATAGSKRKRNYLRSLGIEHIFNSRNTEYGDEILKVTHGRGVNVVLNTLTSAGYKEATLKACAKGARFVEISKLNVWTEETVRELRPDVKYSIVDVAKAEPEEWQRLLNCLNELYEQKILSPIPYVRFDAVNVREALTYLQKAKHIGKVVLVMPELRMIDGAYKAYTPHFNDNSTYLITGGLGGIGFEVCKWMVQKGAKHILLASRSEPSQAVQAAINMLNSEGANVMTVKLDIGNYQQCKDLLSKIKSPDMNLPPLRGIMHAAGTLNDGLVANQDWSKLSSTFNSKVNGTLNLHELTLEYPLEHFVLFSSVVALFGGAGQCNHAAGNNFEDTFAHYRNSMGLCATTVNWGQWGEIGVAVEVELPGMKALSTLQGISALELIMKTQRLQTCVMNMESFVLFCKLTPRLTSYLDERIWKASASATTSMTIRSDEFWQQYDSKEDVAEKIELLKCQVKDILRKTLKLDNADLIEDGADFQEMGVDSLMFIEIKNSLQSLLGDRVTVSASALRDCNNINLLSDQLIKLIEGDESANESEEPPTLDDVAILLKEDCILPEKITAVDRPFKNITDVRKILLTGATGTVGPYILKELSNLPQISEIYCLVRPNKSMSAQERLDKVIEFRDIRSSTDMTKVTCVEGNVTKPRLGMGEADWEQLVERVDAVFHLAVRADHTQYYRKRENVEDVRSVNIHGTKNILEFACANKDNVKHVFFSSALVSIATTEEDGCLSESWPNITDFDGVTNFAYPNSKFVGDILMKTAALERGVPVKVCRLPLISGDSKTGKFNLEQNHMMLRYLFIMKSGVMPFNPVPLALLPVDICASICVKLFFHHELSHIQSDIYNLTHPSPDLDQEFPEISYRIFGFPVEFTDFSEFVQRLFSEPDDSRFSMFKSFYKDEDELMSLYTITKSLRKWLEGVEDFWVSKKLSVICPDIYSGLERTIFSLQRDLQYAKDAGWFEKFGLTART